jgi:NAD(P)-dependent dehydrogenase (short-subunit alcohol dehydrogenase family)
MRTALVTGGSGTLGGEVVRALAAADTRVLFTYLHAREKAEALAKETKTDAVGVDLADRAAVRALAASLAKEGVEPDVFVHCAGVSRPAKLDRADDAAWDAVMHVGARAAWVLAQSLAPGMIRAKRGDIVLAGALTEGLPAHAAASNGALAATAVALAKELGPSGIRANFVALGPLDGGMSRDLDAKLLADYKAFSALRRLGTPQEAAAFLAWLALENTFVTGKSIPVNGGLGASRRSSR